MPLAAIKYKVNGQNQLEVRLRVYDFQHLVHAREL